MGYVGLHLILFLYTDSSIGIILSYYNVLSRVVSIEKLFLPGYFSEICYLFEVMLK